MLAIIGSLNFNWKDYDKYGTEDVPIYNKSIIGEFVSKQCEQKSKKQSKHLQEYLIMSI